MAESTKLYTYEVNGVEHTAQLTETDADRLEAKPAKAAKAPANKARIASNKDA